MIRAATLAVGTEVVDGQILDRNSAWISAKIVYAGIQVIEHRAVPDDRADIRRALKELGERVDLLFVTGGLGPTSDDFTRDLLAEFATQPLEFDPASWKHIEDTLSSRGIQAREIQKQQCYFPRGACVLKNPVGTANAFSFKAGAVKVYALPGPPTEIAAIWDLNMLTEIEALIPPAERERLMILRCLGKGESDIAELTEAAIRGSGIRVGYRAHLPYVEVKLWYRNRQEVEGVFSAVEAALKPWIVSRDDEDAADLLINPVVGGRSVQVWDFATGGVLQERILLRLRDRKLNEGRLPLQIVTAWGSSIVPTIEGDFLKIELDAKQSGWVVTWKLNGKSGSLEVAPAFKYKLESERARRYVTEKALLALGPKDSSAT